MGCKPNKHVIEEDVVDVVTAPPQSLKATNFVWERQDNFHDHYEVIRQIGTGSMGAVFLVEKKESGNEKNTDEIDQSAAVSQKRMSYVCKPRRFAMKTILINRVDKELLAELQNEIEILRKLQHPNIIQLHEVYYHKREVMLVMELCTGGHLDIVKRSFARKENLDTITEFKVFGPNESNGDASPTNSHAAEEPPSSPASASHQEGRQRRRRRRRHRDRKVNGSDSGDGLSDHSASRKHRRRHKKKEPKNSPDADPVVEEEEEEGKQDAIITTDHQTSSSDSDDKEHETSSSLSSSDSASEDGAVVNNNDNNDDDDKLASKRKSQKKKKKSKTHRHGTTASTKHANNDKDLDQAESEQMSEVEVCDAIIQVLQGLAFLHINNIAHRDLKLENIMYETEDPNSTIKLIDFGLSQVYNRGEKMRNACGTIYTMAPEVASQAGYTQQADMWSVGVIAYVLLSGQFPFLKEEQDLLDQAKLDRLMSAQVSYPSAEWECYSKESRRFIGSLFRRRPESRWSATQALEYATDVWRPAAANLSGMEGRNKQNINPAMLRSIQKFANYEKLKRVMLMIVAFSMDKSKLVGLRDAFIMLDSGKEGTISLSEFRNGLEKFGISDEEASKLYSAVDMDGTGRIHYMEFLAATLEARGFIEQERLTEAFERLDTSGSGSISASDIKALLGESSIVNQEVYDAMIAEIEKRSGKITYNEFIDLMNPIVQEEHNPYRAIMTGNVPAEIVSRFDRNIHASRALSTPSLTQISIDKIKKREKADAAVVLRSGSVDAAAAHVASLSTIAQAESDEIESITADDEVAVVVPNQQQVLISDLQAAATDVEVAAADVALGRRSEDGLIEGRERRMSH